jgi:hypothetical protein
MDFITLGDDYRPKQLIEEWSSLIWTERWRQAGDFSLKTFKIRDCMGQMPLGSLVSLQDTREVCIVENHEIEKDAKGADILTVSGRSFETFFENRVALKDLQMITDSTVTPNETNSFEIANRTAGSAATYLMDIAASDSLSTNDVLDAFNATLADDADVGSDTADRQMARGSTYAALLQLLEEQNAGVQNLRPLANNTPTMTLNIYRYTSGVNFLPNVALDVLAGHFTGPVKYTWSIKGMKTAVYVASKNAVVKVYQDGQSSNTGLDHRVDLLDLSDITSKASSNLNGKLKAKGKSYLNKHKKVFAFDGKISPDIPYKYNLDYGLGDRFKIRGDYGAEDTVQIVEYIRSSDKSGGESSYPTYIT